MTPNRFGSYEISEKIAVGGMAEVFRAKVRLPGGVSKAVCLKRIHPHLCTDSDFVTMFIEEARLALTMSHGNIVQAFDFGNVEGNYYLAMELLDGWDLHDLLTQTQSKTVPLPVDLAVYIVMEVLEGLAYAHSLKDESGQPLRLIHRDISPSNVMVTTAGEVKILDFGIARYAIREFRTRPGVVKGKLAYMAPEQARGQDLDARVDIFASGVLLHELLTGLRPFDDDDHLKRDLMIRSADRGVEPILKRALSRDPETRFQKALDMRDALADMLANRRLRPSAASLSSHIADLFEVGEPPPDNPRFADAFDRLLAAQVPDIPDEDISPEVRATPPSGATEQLGEPSSAPRVEPSPPVLADRRTEQIVDQEPDGKPRGETEVLAREQDPEIELGEAKTLPRESSPQPANPPSLIPPTLILEERPDRPALSELDGLSSEASFTKAIEPTAPSRARETFILAMIVLGLISGVGGGFMLVRSTSAPQGSEPLEQIAPAHPEGTPVAEIEAPPPFGGAGDADWEPLAPAEPDIIDSGHTSRGHDSRAKARAPSPQEPGVDGKTLGRDEVLAALHPLRPYLRLCLSRSSEPISFVKLRLQIDGRGEATYHGAMPQPSADVDWCLRKVVGRAKVRATGGDPLRVVYPFHVPSLER